MRYAGALLTPIWQTLSLVPLAAIAALPLQGVAAWFLGAAHAVLLIGPDVVRGPEARRIAAMAGMVAGVVAISAGGWLLLLWLAALSGLFAARSLASESTAQRSARLVEILLILVLAFFCVLPESVVGVSDGPGILLRWLLSGSLLSVAIPLTLVSGSKSPPRETDPVIAVLFSMLTLVLLLSAALLASQQVMGFVNSVLLTVITGEILAVVGWLVWSPLLGAGLSTAYYSHVMSLSVPLEKWLAELEDLYERKDHPDEFWDSSLAQIALHGRLDGIGWNDCSDKRRLVGEQSGHAVEVRVPGGKVHLHSSRRLQPGKIFNIWILARVAAEFRLAKQREKSRTEDAIIRSVHEIGAKTTHDIRNLLHAVKMLSSAPEGEKSWASRREQLAQLAGRLELSLSRLGGESASDAARTHMPALSWWKSARRRHSFRGVTFAAPPAELATGTQVPVELFDRALENLLHNALRKRSAQIGLQIKVEIGKGPVLSVIDTGAIVPAGRAARLFASPLPSAEGMGIGLFQLASAAARQGMKVMLAENREGCVRFVIGPHPGLGGN